MLRPEPISVSQLNNYIKEKVGNDEFLNNIYIKGEISNFKHHYTGHLYFTLKDENSLIKCIMFKTYTTNLNFIPKDGAKVLIIGTVSVFERDGIYQIYCKGMEEDGLGELYSKYEQLKEKLEKEGLFKLDRKKKIPYMPKTIGVLTSKTGSVIRDIINVSTRRNPNVNIKLFAVPVQGEGAAKEIVKGIKTMNEYNIADVIILARGGGSLEDLWPFNEEIVAREIFNSKIPIISAVGHETDFTISDFVADLRAPTPSAAAELAVPDIALIKNNIEKINKRLVNAIKQKTEFMKFYLERITNTKIFKDPMYMVQDKYVMIDTYIRDIVNNINTIFINNKNNFENLITKLDSLSPLKTLGRGYSLLEKEGKIVNSINKIKRGDSFKIILKDGNIDAIANNVRKEDS